MRYLSVCSGIEAATVAWHNVGWTPVGFSEIDTFPSDVLAHHFQDVQNYGDMTRFKEWDLDGDSIDILVGGTPCQSFSVAGLRKGLDDPRGNLSLTFVSMAEHYRPEWIVWENVPGVLSSNQGRDFGSFLTALGYIGYGWAYRVLDAQYFGVPQRRRRVFLVAHSSGDARRAAKVLFEPESLRGNTKTGRKKREVTAGDPTESISQSGCWWDGGQVSQTLDAVLAKGQMMPEKNRFPVVMQQSPILYQSNQTDARLKEETKTCQTILARWGTGGGNTPIVQHTYPIQDFRAIDKCQNGIGVGKDGDPSYTLDKLATQGVAHPEESLEAQRVEAFNHQSGGDMRGIEPRPTAQLQARQETSVLIDMVVRRLTPVECERLQGFPDGWTDISYYVCCKKKFHVSLGKDGCPNCNGKSPARLVMASDSSRYKALGNSMAVPVMRWIGNRIKGVSNAD